MLAVAVVQGEQQRVAGRKRMYEEGEQGAGRKRVCAETVFEAGRILVTDLHARAQASAKLKEELSLATSFIGEQKKQADRNEAKILWLGRSMQAQLKEISSLKEQLLKIRTNIEPCWHGRTV